MKANKITLDSIKSCKCEYVKLRTGRTVKIKECKKHKPKPPPEPPPIRKIKYTGLLSSFFGRT